MADVLADFDPIRSREILQEFSHREIADIWTSRNVYYDIDEDEDGN